MKERYSPPRNTYVGVLHKQEINLLVKHWKFGFVIVYNIILTITPGVFVAMFFYGMGVEGKLGVYYGESSLNMVDAQHGDLCSNSKWKTYAWVNYAILVLSEKWNEIYDINAI